MPTTRTELPFVPFTLLTDIPENFRSSGNDSRVTGDIKATSFADGFMTNFINETVHDRS
jgi:hypothetical protein